MKRRTINQAGFEAAGIIIAVLFIAIIGFAGYKVLNMNKSATEQSQSSSQIVEPETIKTREDLSNTGKSLDKSSGELDSGLNDGALDSDVDAML